MPTTVQEVKAENRKRSFAILAKEAKTAMVIEMALDFAGMTRVLTKGSSSRIIEQLAHLFAKLDPIRDQTGYDRLHADFCQWFTANIQTAEKKLKNGRIKLACPCSYGQAAKVLDITAKVYVYYCGEPSPDIAQLLLPLLHGALDTQIVDHLKHRFPGAAIKATSILDINRAEYEHLQLLVQRAIQEDFKSEIYPVQYDDIMFRRLNRPAAT